jgi:tetratricopeptide (TPR) repeat protein
MVKTKPIKLILLIIAGIHLFNCAGPNYKKMSIEDPRLLLAIQDSLMLDNKNNQNIIGALVTANNNMGKNYLVEGELSLAIDHFKKAISLNSENKFSKYNLLIAEGRVLIKRGNKNGMWDAIEKFSKASNFFPNNGEPFYWMAISYTKLGDTEFDLILESYEKSLSLELSENIKNEVEKKYEKAKMRKQKLDSFWK